MTAPPGENLEFYEGDSYRKRLKNAAALNELIRNEIKNRPTLRSKLVGDFKSFTYKTDTQQFGVIFQRKGNSFNLMNVYFLPDESELMDKRFKELIEEYGST